MRFSDHRPPLFMELGNRDAGYDLTPNEHHLEELEFAPHSAALEETLDGSSQMPRVSKAPPVSPRASAHGALTGPGGAPPPPAAGSTPCPWAGRAHKPGCTCQEQS